MSWLACRARTSICYDSRPDEQLGRSITQETAERSDAIGALSDRVDRLTEALAARLEARAPGLLRDFPPARYAAAFDKGPAMAPYHHLPQAARDMIGAMAEFGAGDSLEDYHRLVLLHLIGQGVEPPEVRLTPEARRLLDAYLERIVGDVAKARKGFHRFGHDQFAKDFAVCRGRLIPLGVELLDPRAGVPRSLLLRRRGRQVVPTLRLIARLGGFRPLWGLHFDRRLVRDFNAEGYTALYLRVADLLQLNPGIRGVSSWSWWHDPRVAELSPELSFIGRHPESAGAVLLRASSDAHTQADALRFAPQRQAAHAAGSYDPCVHMVAWPRRDLIAWARAYRAVQAATPATE